MSSLEKLKSTPSIQKSSLFDDEEWVIQIRSFLETESEEKDGKSQQPKIFSVPAALICNKPEAYVPQLFAFGPYHHWRENLYDMERYKLAAARRTQGRLQGLKLQHLVEQFMQHEYRIRCYYHKYLDHSGETLAWMMAIDACFLLEFLLINFGDKTDGEGYQEGKEATQTTRSNSNSKRAENEQMKMAFNLLRRDISMLENQMPLFLLRKLLSIELSSEEIADATLSKIIVRFIKEVSPFKTISNNSPLFSEDHDTFISHAHLLELLYYSILPRPDQVLTETEAIGEAIDDDGIQKDLVLGDTSNVRTVFNRIWSLLSGISGGPIGFIKRLVLSGPIRFLVKFPWKIVTALPIMSIIKLPVENFFSNLTSTDKSKKEDGESNHADKPPTVEEITIPSVSELIGAGVKFSLAKGDLTTIEFNRKTVTFYLPVVCLDVNTEVILRNLVAYEVSVVSGPLIFTRYTELMNGIIDTEEDVKLLREKEIIVNRMKSDSEAAELWNGMSKSVRLTKVGFLDKVIVDVNKYYRSRWRVKSQALLKKYVFGSWQVLTFLAAALLLLMTCVQSFCSVYSCSSQLKTITNMGAGPAEG